MRIIGGKNKGKKIFLPVDKNTRPLRDMVKESIFNLIEHSNKFNISISNCIVLDLFSGSGSFGLECLSRGAKFITFVENYVHALGILKKNISTMNALPFSEIIENNCFELINEKKIFSKTFDIIFLDPPYKYKNINFLIDQIIEKKILKKTGIILIHRHKKDDIEITSKLNILDTRKYGISKIIIGN
jgi:16S rRNA (guanine966-N2)-methyltransferase